MRQAIPVFILILLTAYGPLSMIDSLEIKETKFAGEEVPGVHDVPDWRIGDKWVY